MPNGCIVPDPYVTHTFTDTGLCDVLYDGHCVVALLTTRLNHGHGQMACEEIGGILANIYSNEEMTLIEDFLKQFEMNKIERLDLRTGMKFKVKTLGIFPILPFSMLTSESLVNTGTRRKGKPTW